MIYLITGFMGAGKSQLLERLAAKGEAKFLDLDGCLMQSVGAATLGEWIETVGLNHFRHREGELFGRLMGEAKAMGGTTVMALGGGTLDHHYDLIRADHKAQRIKLIWLKTPFEECWRRISGDQGRPLVRLGREALEKIHEERLAYYQMADIQLTMKEQDQINTVEDLQSRS